MKKPTLPVLVKQTVTAQLLPPNSILWADAFDGLKADSPEADIEAAAPGFPVFRIVPN